MSRKRVSAELNAVTANFLRSNDQESSHDSFPQDGRLAWCPNQPQLSRK